MIPLQVNATSGAALDGDTKGGNSGISFGNFSVGAGSSAASTGGAFNSQTLIIIAAAAVALLLFFRRR